MKQQNYDKLFMLLLYFKAKSFRLQLYKQTFLNDSQTLMRHKRLVTVSAADL